MSKKALITRMGGIGDVIILTPVARRLHELGYSVDYFVGSPNGDVTEFFIGLPFFNTVKSVYRINGIDCVKDDNDNFVSIEILKKNYDEVFDYKNSIEENRPQFFMKDEMWRHTINSNYINWYDMMFAWTNIDYTKLTDDYKRPEIIIPQKYYDWVDKLIDKTDIRIVGIQMKASTLIRTWYRAADLPEMVLSRYKNCNVLMYDGLKWVYIAPNIRQAIEIPDNLNPIMCSAVLLKKMDCFISADSGYSHVAEALNVKNITIYTTVPAWTRMKYYRNTRPIEAKADCYPCFTLHIYCPLEIKKAKESLNEREKKIFDAFSNGINPGVNQNILELAKELRAMPYALKKEYDSIMQKIDALSATEPACVFSIKHEDILNELDKIIGE